MTGTAVVRRRLKVADPTAITARETLRRAVPGGAAVRGLARSEVFVFAWNDPAGVGEADLLRLVRDTNLIRNPNKHAVEIVRGDEPLRVAGNGWALVFEEEDGDALRETIARRGLLSPSPDRVRTATLWELTLDAPDGAVAEAVRALAVTKGRREGLLGNPHYQEIRVLDRPPTAASIVAALAAGARTNAA